MSQTIKVGQITKTENNTIKYRLASFGDKDNIKEAMLKALDSDPSAYTATTNEYKAGSEMWWNNYLNPYIWGIDHSLYFAELDDQIIGMVGLIKNSIIKKRHSGKIVWFWVDKDFRGLGIGKELMNKIMKLAESDPRLSKINLDVISSQEAAIGLYKKLGFIENGRAIKEIFQDEKYFDVINMEWFINSKESDNPKKKILVI